MRIHIKLALSLAVAFLVLLVWATVAIAQPAALSGTLLQAVADGTIVSLHPRPALPPFEALDEFGRNYFPRATYEEARAQTDFDVLDIRYRSGDADVPGVLVRPHARPDQKWPAIVYNRGGTGDYGRLDHTTIVDLYLLAKQGFVVVASDYRFHGATARVDQWGGLDLDDVLNVVKTVRSLDEVDSSRLFMLGLSRGGTMTYLALKRGVGVRAAAVIAGASDLEAVGKYRPEFVDGDESYDGWAKVWPEFASRAAEHYRSRSAVHWADQIQVPVLILHSRRDRLLPVEQALRMADALQRAGRPYALHIYANDGHSLPLNRTDRNRQIVEWFRQAP
jgi:dipeptidyl aminopeptidase/acylaminoacyl peptidase